MTRTYSIQDMIALPKLTSSDAVVLATQLSTAFADVEKQSGQSEPLPQSIIRAKARFESAREALEAVMLPKSYDSLAARTADDAIDEAWGAFSNWLTGWSRLPLSRQPLADDIVSLHGMLFGEGLKFLTLAYRNQWQESKSRLEILGQTSHRALVARLGGEAFMTHLLEAQAKYGEALGITTPVVSTTSELQEYLSPLRLALKDYVLKVQASIEPDDAETSERAEVLLNPLLMWKSRYASASSRTMTASAGEAATEGNP